MLRSFHTTQPLTRQPRRNSTPRTDAVVAEIEDAMPLKCEDGVWAKRYEQLLKWARVLEGEM